MWAKMRRWFTGGGSGGGRPFDGYDGPNVVEVIVGDKRFPCDVYEDPMPDEEGFRVFWAVPRQQINLRGGQVRLYVDVMPPRSVVRITRQENW